MARVTFPAHSHRLAMDYNLINTLRSVGKSTELFQSADGTEVLILPYGGRVLGLFSPGSDANFYWTNPALQQQASAKALYESDGWHNSGGDRTFVSPELDLFFPNYPDRSAYAVPRAVDPGNYRVEKTGENIRLINRLTLTTARSKASVELEMVKSVGPAFNPLRHERYMKLGRVDYAGYTLCTSLEIVGGSSSRVGLWNLVQMPHGGELLIPTYCSTKPKIYFGAVVPTDLILSDRMIRFQMRQTGEHKLGIRAVATTGRVGYVYQSADKWTVIIRNFTVNPSGEYIDVPWNDPEDLGYSTQACTVNSSLGCFSELEYHIPAIGQGTGHTRCDDAAQVWAFRGALEDINHVVRTLLFSEAETARH